MSNRTYKFRAWDKKDEVMVAFDHSDFAVVSERVRNYALGYDSEGNYRRQDNITYMQYTGLKDCNGVEIYEGDLIRQNGSRGRPFEVKWGEENCGCCEAIIGYIDTTRETGYEVIGNVYEHPELLESKND